MVKSDDIFNITKRIRIVSYYATKDKEGKQLFLKMFRELMFLVVLAIIPLSMFGINQKIITNIISLGILVGFVFSANQTAKEIQAKRHKEVHQEVAKILQQEQNKNQKNQFDKIREVLYSAN